MCAQRLQNARNNALHPRETARVHTPRFLQYNEDMHISIISTKLELTPSLKTFIEEKMSSCEGLVKRFEQNGELTLFFEIAHTTKHHKHGVVFRAEAMLHVPGKTIRVESTNADAHAAIDEVKDAMKRELAEHKEKGLDKKRRNPEEV